MPQVRENQVPDEKKNDVRVINEMRQPRGKTTCPQWFRHFTSAKIRIIITFASWEYCAV